MSEGFGAVRDVSDDDAYDRLFRPEPEHELHNSYATPSLVPEPVVAPAGRNLVDTGRLFRSVHAEAAAPALEAVPAAEVPHLRTLRLEVSEPVAPILSTRAFEPMPTDDRFDDEVVAVAVSVEARPVLPPLEDEPLEPASILIVREPESVVDAPSLVNPRPIPVEHFDDLRGSYEPAAEGFWAADAMHDFDWHTGFRPTGAYVIVIGATLIAGLASALFLGSGTGWLTGLVLLLASALVAARIRIPDASVAVIAPPIAFFLACITVGQIGLSGTGGLVGRVVDVFFALASGWYWVIGPAVVALAIVVWRRRQSD
ncbi:MAG: hypothetical protein F2702_04465 [Actinobacteria bacterium]|uniref:Unannotated protein n=1 Tax=freshwater metagenome TaxID=449393 RepID=A0A6J6TYF6_9ZZZZ|nr:hypothetical protein [Actinomycetota bacterium]